MNKRTVTCILIAVTAVVWVAWDVIAFMDPARGDTESEVIAWLGLRSFSIPMLYGVLAGHFFFLNDKRKPRPWITIPIGLCCIAADIVSHVMDVELLQQLQTWPWIWALAGIPIGALFWTQSKKDKL